MVQAGCFAVRPPPELALLNSCSFVTVLSAAVDALCVEPSHARSADAIPLHSSSPPRICMGAYMERLIKYCRCSPTCVAYAYVYMKRLVGMSRVAVTATSKHRLLLTGTVIAAKLVDDRCFSNNHYARVGGVSLQELNRMELCLLRLLGYRAQVGVEDLAQHLVGVTAAAAGGASELEGCSPRAAADSPSTAEPGPLDGPRPENSDIRRAAGHRRCSMDFDAEADGQHATVDGPVSAA